MKLFVKRFLFCFAFVVAIISIAIFKPDWHIQSDLMSLMNSESLTNEWPINKISNQISSIANIIVESDNEQEAINTSNKIAQDLAKFDTLHVQTNNFSIKSLSRDLIPYKNGLISKSDKQLLQSGKFRELTDNTIKRNTQSMMPNIVPLRDDPFGLLSDYIVTMGNTDTNWNINHGFMWQQIGNKHYVMIPIDTDNSNMSRFSNQINTIYNNINMYNSQNTTVHLTGVPVHSATMAKTSQNQMTFISILSIIAVILFNYLLFKRFITLIPIISSLFIGFLSGTIVLILCFSNPHILTFVFGTTLIGLGVDYSFHQITATSLKNKDQIYENMLHSFLTTVVCFLPLAFSQISLLQQISVFTITGISTIYIGLRLFLPIKFNVKTKPMKTPIVLSRKKRIFTAIIMGIIIVTTIPFVRIENNMRQLYRPNHQIAEQDAFFQKLNKSESGEIMLIRGKSIDEILQRQEEIKSHGIDFFSISNIIPSTKTQIKNAELAQKLYEKQSKYLQKKLSLKNVPTFVDSDILTIDNIKSDFVRNWINKLVIQDGQYFYSVSQINNEIKIDDENVKIISTSKLLNQYIEQCSIETYKLLAICGICLVLLLSVLYKKRAIIYLIPSVFAILLSISILTWFATPINFFHLLSFFIVIGLGIDYTIFNINTNNEKETRPVMFSFLTSFIGFGLLSFTSFFLIKSMGITLGLGLGLSYIISLLLFMPDKRHRRN